MNNSEYTSMFLAESREHLQQLNLAIMSLENNPKDPPTVEQIFRIAHSLKGMSATMGFARIAELTHAMEDVFELLRQRTGGLAVEAIDTVFACLDALSQAIEAIETDGHEALDPAPLVARLRRLVRPRTREQQLAVSSGAQAPDIASAQAEAVPVLHVAVTLRDDAAMPAVRAHMVLAALAGHGELVGSVPAAEVIERFQGRQIEAWVSSARAAEEIAASVRKVSEVAGVEVSPSTQLPGSPQPAQPPGSPQPAQPAGRPQPAPESGAPEAPAAPAHRPVEVAAAASAARTVRVDARRLDALMHLMGELVIHRTAVEALTAQLGVAVLQQAVQDLTRSSQALQTMVMQVRMIPVDVVFLRLPRLVRDLSARLGKEAKLKLVGSETELDRTVVDSLGDPLVHLVRNALDHGLEPPEERVKSGKPRAGTIEISASHAGRSVIIDVRDDGRGIDPEAVAVKALYAGLIDERTARELDSRDAVELLFASGFSTAETASEVSGRGVGLDAVRASIRELGGEVLIESSPGAGTHAQIRLPLTLAIVSALQVDVAGAPFAIPLDRVQRTLRLSGQNVRSVAGRRLLVLEDGVLPLVDGADAFRRRPTGEHRFAVIIRAHDRLLALAVDELVGQRELVTRPLPHVVSDGEAVSGGAVLADGRIALIVDCEALVLDTAGLAPSLIATPARGEAQVAA